MTRVGVIVLAAGSSSRMGKSKQLLEYKGEPLLVRAITTALRLEDAVVAVVLGAYSQEHRAAIEGSRVDILENTRWKSGMGSSIKVGLKHLIAKEAKLEAVLILVCDQPFLSTSHLRSLITTYESSQKPIVASFYADEPGVPVLFEKSLFPILLHLDDHAGAKQIIKQNPTKVALEYFEKGEIDVDTPEDYERLTNKFG